MMISPIAYIRGHDPQEIEVCLYVPRFIAHSAITFQNLNPKKILYNVYQKTAQ